MQDKKFGKAGEKVVIEEYLEGEEASVLAFVDGEHVIPLLPAQDHKRIFDNDTGPNTGGMGAYAPAPVVTPALLEKVVSTILVPTVNGMKKIGREYKGILFAGIMLTKNGPKVLEFNCRFGDPETQAILPLMENDILTLFENVLHGTLDTKKINWKNGAGVCVVLAAGGYPENPETGKEIKGLADIINSNSVQVFHAGTKGKVITSGGRVLGVVAQGSSLQKAIKSSYKTLESISFENMQYRKDIGKKGLQKLKEFNEIKEASKKRIAVLISNAGSGTNLQAVIDGIKRKQIFAKISVVISDTDDALGLQRAQKAHIPTYILQKGEDLENVLAKKFPVDYIVLAGWKKIISDSFLKAFPNRILNIHPGVIPEIVKNPDGTDGEWNKGKFTTKAIDFVIHQKRTYAGSSVHFLSSEFDFGKVLARDFEKVKPKDTSDSLYQRLKKKENKMVVRALQNLSNKDL